MADLMTLRRNIIASKAEKPVAKVYGVEWNYADPSTVLKRTGAAANFANPIPAESLNEVGYSPFDNVYPWSEMKRYNIINGEVAYSEDDAGYSETLYDTMVYIPEFYYYAYKDTANQKWNWSISGTPLEGYEKHPGSGCYVGRFHTSGSSSAVFSKSGTTPLNKTSRANFRTYSRNKGSGWNQIDLATWSAIQLLYLIEFSDWNSQTVMGTGQNSGSILNNGATNFANYHTVKRSGFSNTYRWIENLFSNMMTFVDGFIANKLLCYISIVPSQYNDNISNMTNTGIYLPDGGGHINGFGFCNNCKWAFIPDNVYNSAQYTTDEVFANKNNVSNTLYVGGNYNVESAYGMFYFDAHNPDSNSFISIGSRLMFIPST